MFRGSSHCSTSSPSHRRISTISSTQDFPHREPPLRIWVIQSWSTQLLSQTTTTSTQEVRHKDTQDQPLNKGIGTKPTQSQSPLHLEGYQYNLHNHLYTRGNSNKRRFTTLGGLTKPQTNFPDKTIS